MKSGGTFPEKKKKTLFWLAYGRRCDSCSRPKREFVWTEQKSSGIAHTNCRGSTNRKKKCNLFKKKETSRCLIDACSLRNVVQKHQSEAAEGRHSRYSPWRGRMIDAGGCVRVYREPRPQEAGALRSGRACRWSQTLRKHAEKTEISAGLWVINTAHTRSFNLKAVARRSRNVLCSFSTPGRENERERERE